MDNQSLNRILRISCQTNLICDKYNDWWKEDKTQQELINAVKKEPLFIYRLPKSTFRIFKENFNKQLLNDNSIYIDNDQVIKVDQNKIYLLGNAECTLTLSQGDYEFYLYEVSTLNINVNDSCNLKVYMFDSSTLNLVNNTQRSVAINKIGQESTINADGPTETINRDILDRIIKSLYMK